MVSGSPDVSNSCVSPSIKQPIVSQFRWWCPALRVSPNNCLPVWLVVSGSPDVSNSFVTPYSKSFVSHKNIVNYSALAFGKRQKNANFRNSGAPLEFKVEAMSLSMFSMCDIVSLFKSHSLLYRKFVHQHNKDHHLFSKEKMIQTCQTCGGTKESN